MTTKRAGLIFAAAMALAAPVSAQAAPSEIRYYVYPDGTKQLEVVAPSTDPSGHFIEVVRSGTSMVVSDSQGVIPHADCAPTSSTAVSCAGAGYLRVYGSAGADTISAPAGPSDVWGFDGDDRLSGSKRKDKLVGGPGNDRLLGIAGYDQLDGREGNDVSRAGPGRGSWGYGGSGNDRLFGANGVDRLTGQGGNDYLHGGPDFDDLHGSFGIDVISARDGYGDIVTCGPGPNRRERAIKDPFDVGPPFDVGKNYGTSC